MYTRLATRQAVRWHGNAPARTVLCAYCVV